MAQASLRRRLATHQRLGVYFSFNRTVYILLLFTLGKGLQLTIGQVTINLYVYSLGYDEQYVGIFAAMSAIGALVASVPIGFLADRIGRKPLLMVSGALTPLSLVAIAFTTNPTLLILASLLNGISASPYWVVNLPLLTENTTQDQQVGALAMNSFLLLGVGSFGALIGGLVPEFVSGIIDLPANSTIPLRTGVLVAAFIVLLTALPLPWLREIPRSKAIHATTPEVAPSATVDVPEAAAAMPSTSAPAVGDDTPEDPRTRWGVVILFTKLLTPDVLFTIGEGAVVALLQLYFTLQFGINIGVLGVMITLAGLVGGATALASPGFVRRFGRLRLATSMQYLSAPVMLVIGFSPFFALAALAEFARQMLRGIFEPVYASFAMSRVSTRYRGRLSGFYSMTWSIGYSIGAVVEGWLQQHVGLSASFPVGALFLVTSATLLRLFFGRDKPKPGSLP
ncbi:MAG: hypothetical protein OJF49_000613 [Ktedonobacterales bacterium]|jgi:MFS family permease|nr:MAG: hypothetical protein OJF49_000613 [Ktedonobacterales bacterium]